MLEGRALGAKAAAEVRKSDNSIDHLKAAESRLRQLKAHNEMLEKQVSLLKAKLEAEALAKRQRAEAEAEAE